MIIKKIVAIAILGAFLMPWFAFPAHAAPLLANYYLGVLPTDSNSIAKLSKTGLLILSPDQVIIQQSLITLLKRNNPKLVVLAYVPSQSYNTRYWPHDLIYSHMTVQDSWWLYDGAGNKISPWPGLESTNMSQGWSEYLVGFVNQYIAPVPNVDGIFFDLVGDSIPGVANTNVDLNGDRVKDDPASVNSLWLSRTEYFLQYAHDHLRTKYVVINGSSNDALQKTVNGRMYENFPAPWEAGGSWAALMTRLQKNKGQNLAPQMYIFNANTGNTGNRADYRPMRFGLASSLLADDVYFSFDYGDEYHGQVWWYDEYDAHLGEPVGGAQAAGGIPQFSDALWRREYTKGLAVVNATKQAQRVDLGGDYEKIAGTQDTAVNDGSIVDTVTIGPRDGLILFKTFKTVDNVLFGNGSFLRFYTNLGKRARNGFFASADGVPGGAKVYHGDLDGDGTMEKIMVHGPRMRIYNSVGAIWFDEFPFGGNFKGAITVAVGRLTSDPAVQLLVAGSTSGQVLLYNYHGGIMRDSFYPLGKKYQGGFSMAIRRTDDGARGEAVFSALRGKPTEIMVFDNQLKKIIKRFYPFDKKFSGSAAIAAGDFDGEGKEDIAAIAMVNGKPTVRLFRGDGKQFGAFTIGGLFGNKGFALGAVALSGGQKKEIVVMSSN